MTQEAIQITETPPLPGLKLVQDLNKALQTLATDFAGSSDPAALAGPFMTWADTGNMLLKRRNAANTDWVVLGPLFDYHYARGNILGTVSEDSGVPTGAIIERGSNANGEYVRWADGTQICVMEVNVGMITSATGSIFASDVTPIVWPASFIADGVVAASVSDRVSSYIWGSAGSGSITPQISLFCFQAISSNRDARILAIGRWY